MKWTLPPRARWGELLLFGFLYLANDFVRSNGSILLTWDPSPESRVVGYKVYYGLASNSYYGQIDAATNTTIRIDPVTEGLTNYLAVTAYMANGIESPYSEEISYRPPPGGSPPGSADWELGASVATPEDHSVVAVLTVASPENRYVLTSLPKHGELSGFWPALTYTPEPDFTGGDFFYYREYFADETFKEYLCAVTVLPENDAPEALGQVVLVERREASLHQHPALPPSSYDPVPIELEAFDPDSDALEFTIVSPPKYGRLEGDLPHLLYVPEISFRGSDDFIYVASDGQMTSVPARVAIIDQTFLSSSLPLSAIAQEALDGSHEFRLRVEGLPLIASTLEASSDLVLWFRVAYSDVGEPLEYVDTAPLANNHLFYRAYVWTLNLDLDETELINAQTPAETFPPTPDSDD